MPYGVRYTLHFRGAADDSVAPSFTPSRLKGCAGAFTLAQRTQSPHRQETAMDELLAEWTDLMVKGEDTSDVLKRIGDLAAELNAAERKQHEQVS